MQDGEVVRLGHPYPDSEKPPSPPTPFQAASQALLERSSPAPTGTLQCLQDCFDVKNGSFLSPWQVVPCLRAWRVGKACHWGARNVACLQVSVAMCMTDVLWASFLNFSPVQSLYQGAWFTPFCLSSARPLYLLCAIHQICRRRPSSFLSFSITLSAFYQCLLLLSTSVLYSGYIHPSSCASFSFALNFCLAMPCQSFLLLPYVTLIAPYSHEFAMVFTRSKTPLWQATQFESSSQSMLYMHFHNPYDHKWLYFAIINTLLLKKGR